MSAFPPVQTKADLETLDQAEIVAGYCEYRADDPEPGPNRGRAYWHGWRNAAIDRGRLKPDAASRALVAELHPGAWRTKSEPEERPGQGRHE